MYNTREQAEAAAGQYEEVRQVGEQFIVKPILWTADQLADGMKICKKTLYNRREAGTIPDVVDPGSYDNRWRLADVAHLIK